jgi:hypothetical protein
MPPSKEPNSTGVDEKKSLWLPQHAEARDQLRVYSDQIGAGLSDDALAKLHAAKMAYYDTLLKAGNARSPRKASRIK